MRTCDSGRRDGDCRLRRVGDWARDGTRGQTGGREGHLEYGQGGISMERWLTGREGGRELAPRTK